MRKNSLNLIIIFLAAMSFIWSIWQHEILIDPFIKYRWLDISYFGRNIGTYYDYSLLLKYIGLVGSFLAGWFWSKKDEKFSISILSIFIITYFISTIWNEIIVFPHISSATQIFSGIILPGLICFIMLTTVQIFCYITIHLSLWFWQD